MFRRRSCYSCPDLLKPCLVIIGGNQAKYFRRNVRGPIPAWLSLHQNKLNIVLDDRVRLIGLPQKPGAPLNLVRGVGNLMPDNRSEVVKTDPSAVFLNRGMKRYHGMSACVFPS